MTAPVARGGRVDRKRFAAGRASDTEAPPMPFIDADGTIDTNAVYAEAVPLAKLVGLVVAVALIPFGIAFALGPPSIFGIALMLAGQFVLAVGGGVVLIYVVARGTRLSGRTGPR